MQDLKDRVDLGNCLEVLLSVLYHKLISAGDVVIDGGANGGLHAIPMARLAGPQGRVFAYEPQPRPFHLMSEWASNEGLCIVPRNIAISKKTGSLIFYEHKINDGLSSARVMDGKPEGWNAIEIPAVSVDDENIPSRISFVKLDLEGGEFDALVGAQSVIDRDRPVVACENSYEWAAEQFGYDPLDFLSFFTSRNYRVVDFFGIEATPVTFSNQVMTWEFVAFPTEHHLASDIIRLIACFKEDHHRLVGESLSWEEIMLLVAHPPLIA